MRITQYRDMRPLLVGIHTAGGPGERTNYLDAEDHQFIEQVRVRGKLDVPGVTLSEMWEPQRLAMEDATGSWRYAEARCREADRSHSTFFDDEMLAYWEHRWKFEDRCAHERRLVVEQEARERQELLRQRARDREMAAGELAREELAWQKAQEKLAREREKRLLDTMQADREWEEASPEHNPDDDESSTQSRAEWWKDVQAADRVKDAPFSEQRHYVPIWDWVEREEEKSRKREERAARKAEEEEAARLRAQEIAEETERKTHEQLVARAVEHGRERAIAEEKARIEREWRERRLAEAQWLGEHGRYPPLRPNKK